MTEKYHDEIFGFLLHDVARLLRKRFDSRARTVGLTRAQWRVIAHLFRLEGTNQKSLADILEVQPITLTRTIDRLEEAGWVERRPDPRDKRARLLFLTDKCMPVLTQMEEVGRETLEAALANVKEEDRQQLYRTLASIKRNLSGPDPYQQPVKKRTKTRTLSSL